MNSKERLRHEALKLIDNCTTLEAYLKVTREQAEVAIKTLKDDKNPLHSASTAYELVRLATACQIDAVKFDYELDVLNCCSD